LNESWQTLAYTSISYGPKKSIRLIDGPEQEIRDNEPYDMSSVLDPFRFVLVAVAGWMNQQQLHAIDYLRERIGFYASNLAHGGCDLMTTNGAGWLLKPKQ